MTAHAWHLLEQMHRAVTGRSAAPAERVTFVSGDRLPSAFAVSDLATASIANAALAVGRVTQRESTSASGQVEVDERAAALWFSRTIEPVGWELPPVWDSIAGIYPCGDRFVRLHTNAPHHKAAALRVLHCAEERSAVADAVAGWDAFELEDAVVEDGGVASALRSRDEWVTHPQGEALQSEPLVHRTRHPDSGTSIGGGPTPAPPLDGVRVLDLTRVLAGPVATRLLAGLGADVLRIDPPVWDEAGVAAEVNLGKRCARLDLRSSGDRATFEQLLGEAHILVHGYRRDALAGLGFGDDARRARNPALVDVSLNAWGHAGPWRDRRGFDSIVQIAAGVAHHGMVAYGLDQPRPLPVQALDHATGYTLAACALHGWADRRDRGEGSTWKTSLAAHAELLWDVASDADLQAKFPPLAADDPATDEQTSWGPVRRATPPLRVPGVELVWPSGAADHGTAPATWRT